VLNGDLLLAEGLSEMLSWHREHEALATVGALKVVEAPWEMERIEYDEARQVRTIHRIHPAQERRSRLRPAGLYLFQREVLDYIPASGYFDLKEQLFGPLYQAGMRTALWEIPGFCRTITSVGDYFSANLEVLQGQVPLPAKPKDNPGVPAISPTARIFGPAAVGGGAQVGEEVLILGPAAIGSRCRVGPGAVIDECVVLDNACISEGAYLHRCVIGDGVQIGSLANLHEQAVMQTLAALPEQTVVSLREAAKRPRRWQGPLPGRRGPSPCIRR
jgi:NDP-sugar pyrophosphorylase family protein